MANMRAKMKVMGVTHHLAPHPEMNAADQIYLVAVGPNEGYPDDGSDENNTFAKWTPNARLDMSITNPALVGTFHEGQEFYVDFIEVEGE